MEGYIPTHRDKTAMNGAPDLLWLFLWLFRMANAKTTADPLRDDKREKQRRDPSLRSG
jgi:hypothetical protein